MNESSGRMDPTLRVEKGMGQSKLKRETSCPTARVGRDNCREYCGAESGFGDKVSREPRNRISQCPNIHRG